MSTFESEAESNTRKGSALADLPMKTAGIVGWVLGVVFTAVGTFTDNLTGNDDNDLGGWLAMIAVLAVITYVVYRYWYSAAAAAQEAPNSALIGGLLAVLMIPAFWTGLPSIFAVGAIVLGLRSSGVKPKIGIALAVIAIVVAAWAAIVG